MKKLLSVVMACVLLCCCFAPANVSAAIMWTNINSYTVELQFINGVGVVYAEVYTTGDDATVELTPAIYVKATSGKWIDVTPSDWSSVTQTGSLVQYEFYYEPFGNLRFKAEVTASVTIDGYTETETLSDESTCLSAR